MTPRQHDARVARALAVLALTLPAATALSFAQDAPPARLPSTTPTRMVGEQISTARDVIPFGAGKDGDGVVAWAVGQTRAPSPEPPTSPPTPSAARPDGSEPTPSLPFPTTPESTTPESTTPGSTTPESTTPAGPGDDEPAPEGENLQAAPDVNVLLVGTAANPQGPSAWKRTELPLDAAGAPLASGTWRPAGPPSTTPESRAAVASPHAGESTPSGAAALLVRLEGTPATSGLLARRTDGRFQLLPKPPAALLTPADDISNAVSPTNLSPFAVVDAEKKPAADGPPPTPDDPGRGGRTGVLIVPPGADGVLAWDGEAWTEEPFQDAGGVPTLPAHTPIAIAATPDGDAVALVQGSDPTASDRITLYRRLADHSGWRPMSLDAPLLSGPTPDGVRAVEPTARPGDPLTVAAGHWWVDVLVTRSPDGTTVPATVHLTPGAARASGTTPSPTAPPATATDPIATTTSPSGTAPDETTPDETTPATTATTPLNPLQARSTGVWCLPTGLLSPATDAIKGVCTGELPGAFPTRGYRSQAFATEGRLPTGAAPASPNARSTFGGRIITSPAVEPAGTTPGERDASASGGYLRLDGSRFSLHGGLGETDQADGHTETGTFLSDRLGWVGGTRLVGHVVASDDLAAGIYPQSTPPLYDFPVDVAVAPPTVPGPEAGAITALGNSLRRDFNDGRASTASYLRFDSNEDPRSRSPRAIAWRDNTTIAMVGSNGLLAFANPPPSRSDTNFDDFSEQNLELVPAAANMDLTDVGFSSNTLAHPESDTLDGWAIGRSGAAVHLLSGDRALTVMLDAPITRADLRQLAYAGDTAYVASSAGPLVARDNSFVIDTDLAALIEADGRGPGVRTVAALPDGAVVFDGRYVRNSGASPWERLPSPAEGDVVALAVSRPGGNPIRGVSSLRIQASIADQARPRIGERIDGGFDEGPNEEAIQLDANELAPIAPEGRLTELTPDGWIDRTRTPINIGGREDLTGPTAPIQAIAADPDGTGWAVGGTSSTRGVYELAVSSPRTAIVRIDDGAVAKPAPPADAATTPPQTSADTSPLGTSAALGRASARRRQAADTTPATTPDPDTGIAPLTPESKPIKLLVAGHPACLADCTGREDQGIAPLEDLRQALATSARLKGAGAGALVIGGGRSSKDGPTLSRVAAQSYADLLRSEPSAPPVYPAIGTGDVTTTGAENSRKSFAHYVASPLQPPTSDTAAIGEPRMVTLPGVAPPLSDAGSDTVAYAFDVPGPSGGAARVIVIDNPGGVLNDHDRQASWLRAMLLDATFRNRAAVVIGSAPIDRDQEDTGGAAELVTMLTEGRAAAYVSTDGEDDPRSPRFGPRERQTTVGPNAIPVFHTSALGHTMPPPARSAIYSEVNNQEEADAAENVFADYRDSGAAILELSVPATILPADDSGAASSRNAVESNSVPLFRDFASPEQPDLRVGDAYPAWVPTVVDNDNGTMWTDPNRAGAAPQPSFDTGGGHATPYPCRLWFGSSDCGTAITRSGTFDSSDPSVAVFVRAKLKTGKRYSLPEVLLDANGDPIVDNSSPVLCALKTGTTEMSLTVSGRSVSWPVHVTAPAGAAAKTKSCEFPWRNIDNPPDEEPEPAKPTVPAPVLPPFVPTLPDPGPQPPNSPPNQPQPPLARPLPLAVVPLVGLPNLVPPSAAPPVAPNPKPITQPGTPVPPSGLSHSYVQVASPSVVTGAVAVQQTERREEVAHEGADHQATIYRAAPRSDVTLALAGGALAILIAAAGHLAGRRRSLARAAARRFLR